MRARKAAGRMRSTPIASSSTSGRLLRTSGCNWAIVWRRAATLPRRKGAHLTSWELDPKHPRPLRSPSLRGKSSPAAVKTLTAIDYDEQYYTEHAEAGLDYLNHGFWHESYAALVTESTL